MPTDQPQLPTRAWRQVKKPRRPERAALAEPAWRKNAELSIRAEWRWSKQARVGLALLAFLFLTALLIWVSFWLLPPKNACMVLIGAGYQENLVVPQNVYGWQTLEGLSDLSRDANASFLWGSKVLRLQRGPNIFKKERGADWYENIGTFREKTLFVYLALAGGSDLQGAYLLPDDAGASDAKANRLRLTEVLDSLEKVPPHKNKVLILNATQMTSNWLLGMLENNFVRDLKGLDARIAAIPNLIVISASDTDQRSWNSSYWRQSVFGHYVVEGLRGAASDEDNDGRINAWEMFHYVQPKVETWVRDNRGCLQVPILLPLGAEGETRARRIDLTVVHNYQPPPPVNNPEENLPDELVSAWRKFDQLGNEVPAPADYSPHLWRLYQDLLLRYEQLLWVADLESAARIGERLALCEQEIEHCRHLDLTSFQNTLTMPAVTGQVLSRPEARLASFIELWDAPPAEFAKRWQRLIQSLPAAAPDRPARIDPKAWLRLLFYEFILERTDKDPENNLAKACQWVRVLDDAVSPRPAEVHYLVMLQRDRFHGLTPDPETTVLLQLSLRVRVQAERAALGVKPGVYSFSEEIQPWIQDRVEEADRSRRLGEDLVFATDQENRKKALSLLHKAEKLYDQAQSQADVVRSAVATRNRVLAALPYYSRWLVMQSFKSAGPLPKGLGSLRSVEELWKNTHELVELLDDPHPEWIDPAPRADARNPAPGSLAARTALVRGAFDALENQFLLYCRDLASVDLQVILRDAEDALSVPFKDSQLRQKLLTTLWRTARRLFQESPKKAADAAALNTEKQKREALEERKEIGRREGRLALAVLGERWFDQCTVAGQPLLENYQQVLHRLDTFAVDIDAQGWRSLQKAGAELGYRWQEMPDEVVRLDKQSLDAGANQVSIRDADRLARLIDGAGAAQLFQSACNPVEHSRRLRVGNLLLRQGRRTFEDHWFAEDPKAEPYYRVTGQQYLADYTRLDPAPIPSTGRARLQQLLQQPGKLQFLGPETLQWTTEERYGIEYRLGPVAGAVVPDGYPVLWFDFGPNLEALTPDGPDRLVRSVEAGRPALPIHCTLRSPLLARAEAAPPPRPETAQTEVKLHGLYRGQALELQTNVNLFLLADNLWSRLPPPQTGSIAVRASKDLQNRFGASNGAIAVVLDCSGSMGPPAGEPFGAATKYKEATRALRQVLGRLPKGAAVSLWVFGQAMGPGKTVAEAEKTVQRIQAPMRWDPDDPTQLAKLMAKVDYPAVEPWNESPIMRAILLAREDLRQAAGFKTLLVITDGMDNRFAQDRALNPDKKDIPTVIHNVFKDAGIMINIIGFKVEDEEERKAKEQFLAVEDLPIPGKFYTVNDSLKLEAVLGNALRQQLHYWIDSAENVPVAGQPAGGLDVTRIGENAQWFPEGLAPGGYKVRVYTDRRLEKDLALARGDLLLIDLVADAQGMAFERGLYARSDYPWKPREDQSGWSLAVLQNQQLGDQALQMLATLEKTVDRRESILQLLKPRSAWLEVQPQSGAPTPYCQRWHYLAGYPAPAWSIHVPAWPRSATLKKTGTGAPAVQLGGPATPRLRVWWDPDQETSLAASLDRGPDFQSYPHILQRPLQVDGDPLVVDSVKVEDHVVETSPGLRTTVSCLVVRISHAPNKPIWAQVDGLNRAGQEHRFFTAPARYTGLFWPVTKDQAESLTRLSLISVADFKKKAEQRGFTIDLRDLPAPDTNDNRPPPPISLAK